MSWREMIVVALPVLTLVRVRRRSQADRGDWVRASVPRRERQRRAAWSPLETDPCGAAPARSRRPDVVAQTVLR